ncbi:MAG: type III-B CRISPR module-associated protein Cmr5 [Thermocrinis sp.]|jgi:CRISPR-associated protein Cmr5|uniref:type III-B CRISPR module-associated protein Cmr5 n=1 Tax=Thermocrinis sp. TaxID=2024383 RepID=UPI003C0F517E
MRSKVQKLAQLAYECVKEVKGKEFASKYLSYARKLPSMIIYNGLLTTVAFAKTKAKKEDAWEKLLEHLKEFLRREGINQGNKDLIEFLSEREVQEYRFITKRVLDFSLWLKRIAEGEIEDEGKGD